MLTSALTFIFSWYNLPFTLLLGFCLILAALQLVGLGSSDDSESTAGDHSADTDHDADLDHGAELDQDAGLEHDADLNHDLDHDVDLNHDLDHEVDLNHDFDHATGLDQDHDLEHSVDTGHDLAEAHPGPAGSGTSEANGSFSLLAYLGLGKTPVMVILLILFGAIGLLGWLLNGISVSLFGFYPSLVILAVLPVALVSGGYLTARTTRFIGRTLPPISTTASRAQALVGRQGVVISPFVDLKFGQVHLRDEANTLITVFAIVQSEEPIKRGSAVILVAYDAALRLYLVTRAPEPSAGA